MKFSILSIHYLPTVSGFVDVQKHTILLYCFSLTNTSTVSKDFKYQEAYDYTLKHVFMFSGDPVLVKLRCSKHIPNIYDKMIDEFGDDVLSDDINDDWFEVVTRGSATGIQYIAQKYIDAVYVLYPLNTRTLLIETLSKSLNWHQNSE